MEEKFSNKFKLLDSPGHLEYPSGFDRILLKKMVLDFKSRLEETSNQEFKLDDHVEDASFFGDLILEEKEINNFWSCISVRFSNFGFLATIAIPDYEKETKIAKILEKCGFFYVPDEVLDREYDGKFQEKNLVPTWRTRFFDYF